MSIKNKTQRYLENTYAKVYLNNVCYYYSDNCELIVCHLVLVVKINDVRNTLSWPYLFSEDNIKSELYGMIGISSFSSSTTILVTSKSESVFFAQALKPRQLREISNTHHLSLRSLSSVKNEK